MSLNKRALRVFLCHASGDKPYVRNLYKLLIRQGIDVWLDQEKLLPGQDWKVEIPRAVRASDVVVICLSNNSITKEGYIQKEIKFALDVAEEKPEGTIFLIPARIEDCTVPEKLSRWQWVDLFEENGYAKLLRSLKLDAKAIGVEISPIDEDTDNEVEKRLEQLYTEGLAAFYTEDWNKAYLRFQSILSERPNHQNALEKLEEAELQRDLTTLYKHANNAIQTKEWNTAIKSLEELLKKSPEYRDADQLFKKAKQQKQLADLYAEAKTLYAAEKWQAVVRVFDQIMTIDPNHRDPDNLLPTAKKEVEEIKRLARLNDMYSQSVREIDAKHWLESKKLLEAIHKSQTGFLDTELLLQKVETELQKVEEHKQRINQINILYEQAHGLVRTKNWRKALDKIHEIHKLDSQFEDKDGIVEKVNAALIQEEKEAQKQNQLAALYAEAVRLLKEEKYPEALVKWEEVRAIDPKYPDRQRVQNKIQKKVGNIGKALEFPTFRNWTWIYITSSIALLMTAGYFLLIAGIKYKTIEIPSEKNTGLTIQIPISGYYTFRYSDHAFAAYISSLYNTSTVCFNGEKPIWAGNDLDWSKSVVSFDSEIFANEQAAINAAKEKHQKVYLEKGLITCIVGDGKSDFAENRGTVNWDVYYSLR